jgi:hypothetical protein
MPTSSSMMAIANAPSQGPPVTTFGAGTVPRPKHLDVYLPFCDDERIAAHIERDGEPTWIQAYFVQGPKSIPVSYRLR